MRGILIKRLGGPEVLEYTELPDPKPGPGEALIRVRVAGVNFTDVYSRTGMYPGTVPVHARRGGRGRGRGARQRRT